MVEINGKKFCENCFEEITAAVCPHCGYDSEKAGLDPTLLAPGNVLLGKYVIGSVIGKGGFGVTYIAYDSAAGKKIAVKEYFPYGIAVRSAGDTAVSFSSKENEETFDLGAEKFYNEAEIISKFNGNPNIVEVYEYFYENNTVYLAMEYLNGQTLKDHIRDFGVVSVPRALFIVNNVLNALDAAHGESVLHRDISPDNIIICSDGRIKLIDFGAARQLVSERSQSFSVILKHGFAPIEQYNKKGNQGPWSDIYSVGATMYYMLTGDIPEDPTARFEDDDTFKENRFDIEPNLWEIIVKATKFRFNDRYKSVREMQADLNKLGIEPEPVVSFKRVSAPVSERRGTSQNYKQHIDFTERKKKSFFGRYKGAIIAAGCIIAASAAIAVPFALNRPEDVQSVNAPMSDVSDTSEVTESETAEVTESETVQRISDADENSTAAGKFISEYIDPSVNDYKSKTLYNMLDDDGRAIYDIIYDGVSAAAVKIKFPEYTYDSERVKVIYDMLLNENPQLGYALSDSQGIGVNYDSDDETLAYVNTISPRYSDSNVELINEYMEKQYIANGGWIDDRAKNLVKLHDLAAAKDNLVERDSTLSSNNPFGFFCTHDVSDLGMARAYCYCAQSQGYPAYVVDGTLNGEPRAWCRVKVEDTWYNADVCGDKLAWDIPQELEIDNGKRRRLRTFFLVNDDFMKKYGYVPNEEYEFIYDEEYAANSPESSYYFQKYEPKPYYTDPDEAYEYILEESAKNYREGTENTSCFVPPMEADAVYKKLNERYLADLEEKYGITVSEHTVKYYPDEFVIGLPQTA